MKNFIFSFLCGLFFLSSVSAQKSSPDTIQALPFDTSIRVDGHLNESQWGQAYSISNFTQRELKEGAPPTEKTRIALLYTKKSLYIGVWCFDSEPSKIVARELKRDFDFDKEDNFKMIIDTYQDHRNGYLFVTNPNGAMADAQISDNGRGINEKWDGIWDVGTKITEKGWFAEIRIPFSTLKFSSAPTQQWGINFERNIRRKQEQLLWQGWSRVSELEQVARAGILAGLEGITGVKLLEFRPYIIAGGQKHRGEKGTTVKDLGADFSYLITPFMKVNMTVNPDFATAESDRIQINLTRFSISYPEKREFFLEGANFFEFDMGEHIRPFYSRRIGLSQNGEEVPILGGLRLLGKHGRTTLGGSVMQEAKDGVTPSTNYSVFRCKQDIFEESSIGIIATTKVRSGHFNSTFGIDFLFSTSNLFNEKNLSVGGSFIGSYTSDAHKKSGSAHRLFLSYPNDTVEIETSWERSSGDFNPEVGYLQRTNFQFFFTEIQFSPRPAFLPWIRNLELKPLEIKYYIDDHTKELQSFLWEFRPLAFTAKSGDSIEFNIIRHGENLVEEYEIFEDIVIPMGKYWFTRYEIETQTFSGRPLFFEFSVNWGDFYKGTRTEWEGVLTWRINKHFNISTDFQRNVVSLPAGDFTINEIGTRLNIALTPKLFGSIFAQWNDEDNEILLNFRVNWIPKPGADLFLIVNHLTDTFEKRWGKKHLAVLLKFIWRFAI